MTHLVSDICYVWILQYGRQKMRKEYRSITLNNSNVSNFQNTDFWLHVLHLGADDLMPEVSSENINAGGSDSIETELVWRLMTYWKVICLIFCDIIISNIECPLNHLFVKEEINGAGGTHSSPVTPHGLQNLKRKKKIVVEIENSMSLSVNPLTI